MTNPRPYQAGDTVHHRDTGEQWLLCCDEHQGYVSAAGWPETRVPRDAVDLVCPATDEERLSMLRFAAASSGYRGDLAARQLSACRHVHAHEIFVAGSCAGAVLVVDSTLPGLDLDSWCPDCGAIRVWEAGAEMVTWRLTAQTQGAATQ
jgi:hypothetical protein